MTAPTATATITPAPVKTAEAPYLSVILPVYNGEAYIREALDSMLGQPRGDFEIIIGEDGSTDGTLAICQKYAARDPRIRINHHENYRVGKNCNTAMDLARGHWMLILDADDAVVDGFYTDALVSFLKKCETAGIDTIVPARLLGHKGQDDVTIERVPDYGVVGHHSPESWDIAHEVASILFNLDNIRRNNLRFYEGWVEMETIFRHQAAYTARKLLFTNDFYFSIRYLNEQQITATWDFFKVSPLRIDGYRGLAEWHEAQEPRDPDAIAYAWLTLSDIVVDYVLDAYARYGLGSQMDEALAVHPVDEVLAHLPRQFDRAHRFILKGRKHARILNWARDHRDRWHSNQHQVGPMPGETAPLAEFQKRAQGFPEAYLEMERRFNLS